ncbi:MAG: tripartite tricarboxylate transporter TctB family protein, partial [Deltaproteobacteria bacterium]|nr:tripartite tricarboxylate transporter TctB family protein [Deltaproteobacteria bacterium]
HEKTDREIWPSIHRGKLFFTLALLFIYTLLFNTLGFIIATIPLLFFLYRLMEPRPWWVALIASVVTTGLFYLGFKVGLDSQLPPGILGF